MKYLPIVVSLVILILIATLITYCVVMGRFGNFEIWRISFSVIGFIIIATISLFFIYRLKES